MRKGKKYKLVQKDYNSVSLDFHNSYDSTKEFAKQIDEFLDKQKKGARLLNIGGTLAECQYFADLGMQVTNIDISRAMIRHIKRNDSRIDLRRSNISNFRDKQYDLIWACRSLIHIPPEDLKDVLTNILPLLNKDGTMGVFFFTSLKEKEE